MAGVDGGWGEEKEMESEVRSGGVEQTHRTLRPL